MFIKTALLVLKKDFAIEVKSGEMFYTTLFFAVACVMIFSFAFVRDGQPIEGTAAGILWISVLFAGNLALGRTFERERYGETIRALLLAPAPRAAIYVGKLLGIVLLMTAAELLLVPMVAFLFQEPLFERPCPPGAASGSQARLALRSSARCSLRCSCASARVKCCCRSCCIR